MTTKSLGAEVYGFFEDHLKCHKGLSAASIHSYRDGIRLFLQFVARDTPRTISRLILADLTADRARRFLSSLETERANQVRTRNQRLSVLQTFFAYLASQVPEVLVEAERVAAIPHKRAPPPVTFFLEHEQIEAVLAHVPTQGFQALRDRTLLLFLYNTGARVQEVADLRLSNLQLTASPRVQLHGKGDKWRACPLWEETAALLRQLQDQPGKEPNPDAPVFQATTGGPLTRHGIYKIVRRHTHHLRLTGVDGRPRHVSPHCFRHATAVHLLESGVELNVIRGWLGHAGLATTYRYAEISLRMKQAALAACEPPVCSTAVPPKRAVWRDDATLLNWLKSL